MKLNKITASALIALVAALAACGEDDSKGAPISPSPEATPEGEPEGQPEGQPEAQPEGQPEAQPEGQPEGQPEAQPEGEPGAEPNPEPEGQPEGEPEGQPEAEPEGEPEVIPTEEIEVLGGDVSGQWCGQVTLRGSARVPAGQELSICAGSSVRVVPEGGARVTLEVEGALQINGTPGARVAITSDTGWAGILVSGRLDATHVDVSRAERCLRGQMASEINVSQATFTQCGTSLVLANGGTFEHTTIIGGDSVTIDGGVLRMVDSTIDFQTSGDVPDCTRWSRGGAVLDHVLITGCHCPLHFGATTEEVTVTNSIFDRASFPIMVAIIQGTFANNHILGGINQLLDIGGSIDIDIRDNYYGGQAPDIGTGDLSQFRNADAFLNQPVPGVGPRD